MDHPGHLSSKVPSLWPRELSPADVWQMSARHLPETALHGPAEERVRPLSRPPLHGRLAHQRRVSVLQPRVQGAAVRQAGVQPHPQPRVWMWGGALPGAGVLLEAQELPPWVWSATPGYVPAKRISITQRQAVGEVEGNRLVLMTLQDSKLQR